MVGSHSYYLRSIKKWDYTMDSDASDSEADASDSEENAESDPDWNPDASESEADASEENASESEADASEENASESEADASEENASESEADASESEAGTSDSEADASESEADASESEAIKSTKSLSFSKVKRVKTYFINMNLEQSSKDNRFKTTVVEQMSPDEKHYFKTMSPEEKKHIYERYSQLWKSMPQTIPFRFKLLSLPSSVLSDASKRYLFEKYQSFQEMNKEHGEYSKYASWFESLQKIPFGIYHRVFQDDACYNRETIGALLTSIRAKLDSVIAEQSATKDQLLLQLAQWISNPESKGKCIGIQGPPGIGKTTLIKEGVSKILGIPFGFITLGGVGDGSILEGHPFTYEGAMYGRIVELLIKLNVMNPILFFDELDKIADSPKGEEVTSVLTHITDASQNNHFTDKYFGDIEIDLSRCLMVFTFNDESKIHPVLKDRLYILRIEGYTPEQKFVIARNHLIPNLLTQYRWESDTVIISDSILRMILTKTPEEEGVRNLLRSLDSIFGWINMAQFVIVPPLNTLVVLPFILEEIHLTTFMPRPPLSRTRISSMYI
jgi:ATP-dependent Lon protease